MSSRLSPFLRALMSNKKELTPKGVSQPMHYTHPHLLKPGELTPGIPSTEYAKRRKNFMESIPDHSIVLIPAAKHSYFSRKINYKFRQDASFLYLTGLQEPEGLCVLTKPKLSFSSFSPKLPKKSQNSDDFGYYLFVKARDANKELWDGPVVGEKNAKILFDAEEAWPLSKIRDIVKDLLHSNPNIYTSTLSNNWTHISSELNMENHKVKNDFDYLIQKLMVVKSRNELNLMRKSAEISSNAFAEVMRAVGSRELHSEKDIETRFEYEVKKNGAQFLSYPPVVAYGSNATTLHYGMNCAPIDFNGGLILMDAGAEVDGYTSDITRTFPASGKFTSAERDMYNFVLELNTRSIELCRPENDVTLKSIVEKTRKMVVKYLEGFGIPESDWRKYYPHDIGHYLGMDLHDCPNLHNGVTLRPGMTFTIEPGIYFPVDCEYVPPSLRGVGIRIEDDIAMTNGDPEIFSKNAPKTVEEIENVMRGQNI
eukprot:TRINITY_DN10186_c0_g1_i1.p1 TRINITY_DN10186_c0_g1~~TRINITY_DN10186_c0_g1_i1.p1  ORF type:complete len:482 (-),score=86.76 TRINITY_DN10186_c0_g1_i1:242-1687(-)